MTKTPYRAVLKPDGMVEAFTVTGQPLTEYNGPWSKKLQDKLQSTNNLIHLEGFDNFDSRMKGVYFDDPEIKDPPVRGLQKNK